MPELLAEAFRGKIAESRHYGHVAVCDSSGQLLAWAGEPDTVTYIRSAAKPIQALNVFASGAHEKYGFTDEELAIMCSSHFGEEMHQRVILGIMDKLGLTLDSLLCGCPLSINPELREKQLRENVELRQYNSDCSGKHCGFLAACLACGYPTEGYNRPEHPLQRDVLKIVSDVSGVPEDEIAVGVDGFTVPVHALPLRNMAMAYARIANPEKLPEQYRFGAERVFRAMNAAPEMVAGTGGFCTALLRAAEGSLIGKVGAEAVYCVGVKGRDLGIAIKVDDGNGARPLRPTVIRVLKTLGVLNDGQVAALGSFAEPPVYNDVGAKVGFTRSVVELHFS